MLWAASWWVVWAAMRAVLCAGVVTGGVAAGGRSSDPNMDTDIPGSPLSPADFENSAEMIHDTVDTNSQADPIELAGLFQGDIMLHHGDILLDLPHGAAKGHHRSGRSALIDVHRRWPNGIIPYVISQTYGETERGTIAKAMSEFHAKSCIRFVPRTIEKDYIHILKGDGCSSSVGRAKGAQQVSLGPGCLYVGIVMHEFMHAAGFWHEQSRSDRDNFITINKLNVQDGIVGDALWAIRLRQRTEADYYTQRCRQRNRPKTRVHQGKCPMLFSHAPEVLVDALTEECADNVKHCQMWADMGECELNPTWMYVSCRKACRQCVNPTTSCEDKNKYCKSWSKTGQCHSNKIYMLVYCKVVWTVLTLRTASPLYRSPVFTPFYKERCSGSTANRSRKYCVAHEP
ncbi:Zinc metalloproteinase nas-4-like 1 [Homarus americanus]|uniref:Metalloendopeptidase n=1 Tax=Homarus americanus TaxID=6706 RepID=A0A8J5JRV3_HOMAM|nr:Zinc metalloproteinase nas-4-like 1 [Homarus americanus]